MLKHWEKNSSWLWGYLGNKESIYYHNIIIYTSLYSFFAQNIDGRMFLCVYLILLGIKNMEELKGKSCLAMDFYHQISPIGCTPTIKNTPQKNVKTPNKWNTRKNLIQQSLCVLSDWIRTLYCALFRKNHTPNPVILLAIHIKKKLPFN